MRGHADDIGSISANMNLGEPGTVREHVMQRFLAALVHYSEHERGAGLARLSKVRICEYYMWRVDAERAGRALLSITLAGFVEDRNRRGYRLRLGTSERALRKALHDVGQRVNDHVVRLRTNGNLVITPGGELDAPLAAAAQPAPLYIEGAFDGGVVRLALPPLVRIRDGAVVHVTVAAADLVEDASAPRPLPAGALSRLIGAASLGGDSVVDAEDWER